MSLGEGYIVNSWGDEVPAKQLIVFRALHPTLNPLTSDFTILGFRKIAPHYDRGRKVKAEYKCIQYDDLVVEKIFQDVRDSATNRLTDLEITFNFYNEDGTLGLTKTEIVKTFNKAEAKTEERKRRFKAIDFLISEGEDTPIEPIMAALLEHYHDEQERFKEDGTSHFADAINAETDPTINGYLDIRVPFTSNPSYTVPIRESILYQISALDEAGLLATLQPA